MELGIVLRARYYPKFVPGSAITSFKLRGWRILVINSGTVAGKPLLCQRFGDKRTEHFNFMDLEKDFLMEDQLHQFYAKHGFTGEKVEDGIFQFHH